jgi:hypothetical protein
MFELYRTQYKTIWISTTDAVASADRKTFTFNNLPLIKIIGEKNILKINSITLSGDGLNSAPGHNWTIKLGRVKFNNTNYFNTDLDTIPTICMINYDTNNSIQNGNLSLEIEKQDINEIELHIESDDNHGAVKNSQNIEFNIGICIEEWFYN